VSWLGIPIHFIGAFLFAWIANWFGRAQWRHFTEAHWTERTRLLWPARTTATSNMLVIPLLLDQAHRLLLPATTDLWIPNALAAVLGVLAGGYQFDRELYPQMTRKSWIHHVVAGWGIRFGIWIGIGAGIALMPADFGWKMLIVLVVYLVLHFAMQSGFVLWYLRWVGFMHPAGEKLQRIVNECTQRSGARVKATWEMDGVHALAFAFPTTGELVFSKRLLEICSEEEIAAICAHEMAHLAESKLIIAVRWLGSLAILPLIFLTPLMKWGGIVGLLGSFWGYILLNFLAQKFTHRMELRADSKATASQHNEGVYAQALEKLYRENWLPAVNAGNQRTHPHLYDRMTAAGITPDYPRPKPPSKATFLGYVYGMAMGALIAINLISTSRSESPHTEQDPSVSILSNEVPSMEFQILDGK
jgi:Zn-dependent protease with chaperone function